MANGNAQPATPPPEHLQYLIDQAAHLNTVSVGDHGDESAAIRGPGGVVGFRIRERLHRLDIDSRAPSDGKPLRASHTVGEPLGRFDHLWMLCPDDFVALPGSVPPPTPLDPSRSQRLVMLDSRCRLNSGGQDGFLGFGTGRTVPSEIHGRRRLLVDTVGTILEGQGRFADHPHGTYCHVGELDVEDGFLGNMLLRVMDPQATLRSERSLPELRQQIDPEPGITYLLLRGEAVPSDPVSPKLGPDGRPIGLIVEQGLRLLWLDTAVDRTWGVRARTQVGQRVGKITAHVVFDPAAAAGSPTDPIPFTTWDEMLFEDADGNSLGRLIADSSEGRVFGMELAGQRTIRFGGVGKMLRGEGPFAGIEGQMSDNSVVVFEPHVSASVYLLRLFDPDGRFSLGA